MKAQMKRMLAIAAILALGGTACDKLKEATGSSETTTEETTSTDTTSTDTAETTPETTPEAAADCPSRFKEVEGYAAGEGVDITCNCAPDATTKGSLWGTDTYTTDSSICRAALHAGVITAEGGEVTAKGMAGCDAYAGTEANGTTSSKWPKYPGSFYFPSKGEAKCSAGGADEGMFINAFYESTCVQAHITDPTKQKAIIAEIQARYGFNEESYKAAQTELGDKANVKAALDVKMKGCTAAAAEGFAKAGATAPADDKACPDRFKAIPDYKSGMEMEVTCNCAPDATKKGSLWGSGTYTTDSSICRAALHAGVIKAEEGGEVTAKSMDGCDSYEGSESNGTTSSKWAKYPDSFFFPSAGEVECAGEKKVVVAKKYKVGNFVARGLKRGDIQQGELRITISRTDAVKGFFKGKAEGKFFNIPIKGSISKSGSFNASGRSGRNNIKITGKATTKSAGGMVTGKINSKGFKLPFTAK